jgi:putative tricarboxylic transport membrane protein
VQLRRTLQLSNGEISGLWSTPLAKFVYLIIAIVLLWPLIARFLLRGRHPLAEAAAEAPAQPEVPVQPEPPAQPEVPEIDERSRP